MRETPEKKGEKKLSQGENYNFLKVHLSFLALKQKRNIE